MIEEVVVTPHSVELRKGIIIDSLPLLVVESSIPHTSSTFKKPKLDNWHIQVDRKIDIPHLLVLPSIKVVGIIQRWWISKPMWSDLQSVMEMSVSYNSSKLNFVALGTHVGGCSKKQIDNLICQLPCLLCIWSSQYMSRNRLALPLNLKLEHFTLKVNHLFKLSWNTSIIEFRTKSLVGREPCCFRVSTR